MRRLVGMRTGIAFALAVAIGTGTLLAGWPRPVAASHSTRSTAERTVRSLRMEIIVKSTNPAKDSYSQVIIAGAKRAAAQFGVQSLGITGANADGDVAGQIRLMQDAIARHPDFIVLAPTNSLLAPLITRACRAGIKTIIIDSPPNTSNYQTYVAADD